MTRSRWLYPLALVVLSALTVGTMWVVPYLPTNDGPEWIYATHVENHYADPGTPYAEAYIPALQFASRGLSLFYGPFEAWLGWQRGLQVGLSLVLLCVAWGFVALVAAVHPARRALGFLGFPLALSWSFYMGFWSFVIATGLGFFVLAAAVRFRNPTWRERGLIAVALLAVAVAHVFGAVLAGGALLALALSRAGPGRRLRELGLVLLTGAPAATILLACVLVSKNLTQVPMGSEVLRLPWINAIEAFPRTLAPGPLWRALPVTAAVLGGVVWGAVRARRAETSAEDRAFGIAALLLIATTALAPFQIPGWQAFSERFAPLGLALLVAALPPERARERLGRLLAPGLFAISALYLGATYPFHRRLAALCPDAIRGLSADIQVHGFLLPVILGPTELPFYNRTESEVPLLDPLVHMGNLYAAAHGGIPLNSFAGNVAVHPFVKRPQEGRLPEPDFAHYTTAINSYEFHHDNVFRHKVDDQLAGIGTVYGEIAVFGARPDDLAVFARRGYVADWEAGSALVGHFEACVIDFTVLAADASPGPTFDVHAGEIGLLANVHVPYAVAADGLAHFKLAPAPCGFVRVRATWSEGKPACSNANAEGEIVAKVTRMSGVVACTGR